MDRELGGGLLPGTLTVVAGATGIGKTQLGLRWAEAGVADGRIAGPDLRPDQSGRFPEPRRPTHATSSTGSCSLTRLTRTPFLRARLGLEPAARGVFPSRSSAAAGG